MTNSKVWHLIYAIPILPAITGLATMEILQSNKSSLIRLWNQGCACRIASSSRSKQSLYVEHTVLDKKKKKVALCYVYGALILYYLKYLDSAIVAWIDAPITAGHYADSFMIAIQWFQDWMPKLCLGVHTI